MKIFGSLLHAEERRKQPLNDNKIPTNSLHSKNTSHLNSLLQAVTALRFMRRRGERDVCPVKD